MDNILEELTKNKPKASASTLNTYTKVLRPLLKRVDETQQKMETFFNYELMLDMIREKPLNSQRTILSALYAFTNDKRYHEEISKIRGLVSDIDSKREMNAKQEAAFKSQDEIHRLFDNYKPDSQEYLILSLLSGKFIPPRRALDFTEFKISGKIDKIKDNFLKITRTKGETEKGVMVFNRFKNSAHKGQQCVEIPTELLKIIKKHIKLNKGHSEYLLYDSTGSKLDSVKMNYRLNNIFGKGCGIHTLRHSFLTCKYSHLIEADMMMEEDFKLMGSNSNNKQIYIQKMNH